MVEVGPYICEVYLNHGEPKATPGRHLPLEQLFSAEFVRLQTDEGTIRVFGSGRRLMLKLNVVNCYHILIERSNDWAAVAVGCGVPLVLLVLLVLVLVVVWKKRRDNYGMV